MRMAEGSTLYILALGYSINVSSGKNDTGTWTISGIAVVVWDYAGLGSGPVTSILPHMVVQHYNTLPGEYTALFVRQVGGL